MFAIGDFYLYLSIIQILASRQTLHVTTLTPTAITESAIY